MTNKTALEQFKVQHKKRQTCPIYGWPCILKLLMKLSVYLYS